MSKEVEFLAISVVGPAGLSGCVIGSLENGFEDKERRLEEAR